MNEANGMALRFDRVGMTYPDGTEALREVSFGLQAGEFVTVVGPSGCGKTTTLRMISGLETVTGGAILLGGRNVTWLHPSERDIAFVFQFFAL